MSNTVKLNWVVDGEVYDKFREYVHAKHGDIEGYLSREVREAMREFLDVDEYAEHEMMIDRLIRAAGQTPADTHAKKISSEPVLGEDAERARCKCRTKPDLKEEFSSFARNQCDETPGVTLSRALRARLEGGRAGRLKNKLERVIDDAENLLSELHPEDDGMSLRERRTVTISSKLGREFTEDDLLSSIKPVAGDSDPTIREYRKRVLEYRGAAPHPNVSNLYIPEERVEDLVESDEPAAQRKEYEQLTREEKVSSIRIELARKSVPNNGCAQMTASDVRNDVFYGKTTTKHATKLMMEAAEISGFNVSKSRNRGNKQVLRISLNDVTDRTVQEAVESVLDDGPGEVSYQEADAELDALTNSTASVLADGGKE